MMYRPFKAAPVWALAVSLTLLSALAIPVRAAEPGPTDSVARLHDALAPRSVFDKTLDEIRKDFVETFLKKNKGKEAEIGRLFDDTVAPAIRARFDALRDRRIAAMRAQMSPAVIDENLAFWSGASGQAVLAVPRDDGFGDAIFSGMGDRLGMFDGLALKNRLDDLNEAMRDAVKALPPTGGQ
jgi:hypothetical protein